ncbi:MAG: hypothetical protein GC152_02885 [Alphaproteobacteria bacterium]|nr:hypothetical protein [Alphaproteobacteria bacterium]
MKKVLVLIAAALIASASLSSCGKKARLRSPTDDRARAERESAQEKAEDFSDERYEANQPQVGSDQDDLEAADDQPEED